jgi:hypothetical protein
LRTRGVSVTGRGADLSNSFYYRFAARP